MRRSLVLAAMCYSERIGRVRWRGGGGGVLLYVREELSPVEFHTSTEYPEHVWCRLGDDRGRGLLVGVCYRTTSLVFDCDVNARLREVLTELRDERVLLMGDFNYPGVDWLRGDHVGASPEGGVVCGMFVG